MCFKLHARRDNLFAAQMKCIMISRSISRSLPRIKAVEDHFISFSAGEVAEDGEGKHSSFAFALAKTICQDAPIGVRRLFDFVKDDVMRSTNKKQQR